MSRSYPQVVNLVGALALAVCDRLEAVTEHAEGGVDAREAMALVTLAHYPDQSVDALRRTLSITHSGAVRLVDRLEDGGLLLRRPSGRGRTLAIRLTPRGKSVVRDILSRRQRALEELVDALTADQRAALTQLARHLLAGLTTDRQSARQICRFCDEAFCVRESACPVDLAAAD
jgi:MarR family transcriptional regulator, negative regulator of the multidrug operon emrRAB